MTRARLAFALLLTCWMAALGFCAASLLRGEWNEFGLWLAQLPAMIQHPGRRRAFLGPWLLPLAAAYALTLASGVFWGLRRTEAARR
jgi:hypothetical protein